MKEEQLKYFCVHRPDADVDYINTLLREVNDPEVLVVAGLVTNSILFCVDFSQTRMGVKKCVSNKHTT